MSDPDVYRRLKALEDWQDAMASVELPISAGAWTPGLAGSGGGAVTYTSRSGYYVRCGPRVSIWIYIEIATTTLSGTITISTLPFTSDVSNGRAIIPASWETVNLTAGYTAVYGLILNNTGEFRVREMGDNVATSPIQGVQIAANTILEFNGSYITG